MIICAGGDVALLYPSKELEKLQIANFDQKIVVHIIQNALKVSVFTFSTFSWLGLGLQALTYVFAYLDLF